MLVIFYDRSLWFNQQCGKSEFYLYFWSYPNMHINCKKLSRAIIKSYAIAHPVAFVSSTRRFMPCCFLFSTPNWRSCRPSIYTVTPTIRCHSQNNRWPFNIYQPTSTSHLYPSHSCFITASHITSILFVLLDHKICALDLVPDNPSLALHTRDIQFGLHFPLSSYEPRHQPFVSPHRTLSLPSLLVTSNTSPTPRLPTSNYFHTHHQRLSHHHNFPPNTPTHCTNWAPPLTIILKSGLHSAAMQLSFKASSLNSPLSLFSVFSALLSRNLNPGPRHHVWQQKAPLPFLNPTRPLPLSNIYLAWPAPTP